MNLHCLACGVLIPALLLPESSIGTDGSSETRYLADHVCAVEIVSFSAPPFHDEHDEEHGVHSHAPHVPERHVRWEVLSTASPVVTSNNGPSSTSVELTRWKPLGPLPHGDSR